MTNEAYLLIDTPLFQAFKEQQNLTVRQIEQFSTYLQLLLEWNQRMNLTAITKSEFIITDHFQDSLAGTPVLEYSHARSIADVGAGAGFPGIPLLITHENITALFIEVNQKKRLFLQTVIEQLGLQNRASLSDLDWRTFIRTQKIPIDLFVARASLRPDELLRIYGANNFYNKSFIGYWASQYWKGNEKENSYKRKEIEYTCGNKERKIIIFGNHTQKGCA